MNFKEYLIEYHGWSKSYRDDILKKRLGMGTPGAKYKVGDKVIYNFSSGKGDEHNYSEAQVPCTVTKVIFGDPDYFYELKIEPDIDFESMPDDVPERQIEKPSAYEFRKILKQWDKSKYGEGHY